ncbi:hypothetical protein E2C01_073935 [Portunus trituberculatus]|uniref:Tesmin/TSO1-like CXC domain-containing protein n=1 Tax=Portunus trituberculatus TaxID=210409 RepID=A0A5B7IC02_PORTR|nr:hypothetical protein [Portunus trituberculatus]
MGISWINEIVQKLGPRKWSQLLGVHAMSGCDTVSYPFGKGKTSALKLLQLDLPGLDGVLGQPGATSAELKATGESFFLPLYGQTRCSTMNEARARLFTKQKKPSALKKLPPTDANLMLHVLRAHHQMLLWKAADQRDPSQETENIVNFGWNCEGSTVTPAVSTTPVAPQGLLDIVSCNCVAQGKAYSSSRCSCHSAGLSCTNYCKCEGGDACHSHFTSKQDDEENLDDDH